MHSRDKYYKTLLRVKADTQIQSDDDEIEIIRVDSVLDARAAVMIKSDFKRMLSQGRGQAVIDLTLVESVDSAGLGSLVSALRAVREIGGSVRLVSTGGRVLHMLELTALTRVFKVHSSMSAALAAFSPIAA